MSLWDVHKSPQHSLTTMHLTQCVSRSTYFFSVSMRHALIWEPHLTLVESTTLCHPTLLCPAPFTVTLTQLTKGPYLELAKLREWKTTIETNSRPLIMGLAPSTLLPSVTNSLLMNVGRPRTIEWVQIFFDDTKNGILFSITNCKVLQSTNTPTDRALSKQASQARASMIPDFDLVQAMHNTATWFLFLSTVHLVPLKLSYWNLELYIEAVQVWI